MALIGTPLGDSGKTLFLGNAVICDLEGHFDLSFGAIMEKVAYDIDVRVVRDCLKAGLAKHHADDAKTSIASNLLDEHGIAAVSAAIVKELTYAVTSRPKVED